MAEAFRARYIQPRRLEVRGILDKGLQRGELKKNLDLALFTDLIYGAIFYRLLVSGDPVDDNYVKQLFSACLKECVCLKANRLQPCGVCGGDMSSLYSDVPMHTIEMAAAIMNSEG